jgi:hypothetical protein
MPAMLSLPVAPTAIGAGAVVLLVAASLLVRRLRAGSTGRQVSGEERSELLHNGLRAQATITSVRITSGGRVYVTTASAVDPVSGRVTSYTQRGVRSVGRRGEPVTVLVDAKRPHIYLIVAS